MARQSTATKHKGNNTVQDTTAITGLEQGVGRRSGCPGHCGIMHHKEVWGGVLIVVI